VMPGMDGLDDYITGGGEPPEHWGRCPKCGSSQEDAYAIDTHTYQCCKCSKVYEDVEADDWGKP
jgi:hypothetical protein